MISYSGQRGKSRKILVVIQFTFTIILIFCTLVLYQQINFFQSKDLGFNKDNVIYFASYGQYGRNFESAKNELLQNPDILGISRAFPPGRGYRGSSDVSWEGMDNSASVTFFSEFVDYDYLNVFKIWK